jgi:hypothetical protein
LRPPVCYNRRVTRPLRALASAIAAIVSMVGVLVYEHYSLNEPPGGGFTIAIATAAALLTWLVTALD